jgi:hypothetical protein
MALSIHADIQALFADFEQDLRSASRRKSTFHRQNKLCQSFARLCAAIDDVRIPKCNAASSDGGSRDSPFPSEEQVQSLRLSASVGEGFRCSIDLYCRALKLVFKVQLPETLLAPQPPVSPCQCALLRQWLKLYISYLRLVSTGDLAVFEHESGNVSVADKIWEEALSEAKMLAQEFHHYGPFAQIVGRMLELTDWSKNAHKTTIRYLKKELELAIHNISAWPGRGELPCMQLNLLQSLVRFASAVSAYHKNDAESQKSESKHALKLLGTFVKCDKDLLTCHCATLLQRVIIRSVTYCMQQSFHTHFESLALAKSRSDIDDQTLQQGLNECSKLASKLQRRYERQVADTDDMYRKNQDMWRAAWWHKESEDCASCDHLMASAMPVGMMPNGAAYMLSIVSEMREAKLAAADAFDRATCINCNRQAKDAEKFKACGGCHKVQYCGIDCQQQHWKTGHRSICFRIDQQKQSAS